MHCGKVLPINYILKLIQGKDPYSTVTQVNDENSPTFPNVAALNAFSEYVH